MNNCKNRQRAAVAAAGVLGILLLAAPEAAAEGFASGTALCLASVLPALFPFFVVCELLTAAPPPARRLRPLQRLVGLVCGIGTAGRSAIRRASHQPPGRPAAASSGLLLRAWLCHRLRGRTAAGPPAAGGIIVRRTACGKPRGNGLSGSFFCFRPSKPHFFRRPPGIAHPAADGRAAPRHLLGRQCKPVCLRVRGVFPHRGRGYPSVFTGAAPAAQCCAGDQRRLRGCCRAGRAGGALRLLRCFESARPFSLVPDTVFFRGCVLPARPAAEPGTALFLFAGADPALRALFAGQSGCLQQPFGKGRANFPAAARCSAAGFCLSVRSTLQGSTKPL